MLKGTYTFKTGHTDKSAFLTIGKIKDLDFINEIAKVNLYVYKSETAMKAGALPEIMSFALVKEAQTVSVEMGSDEKITFPAFADIFGIDKLQDPTYNAVQALYGFIMTLPQFSGWELI
jgi:hypothetical protein